MDERPAAGDGAGDALRVACWRVRDSGLLAAPPRHRRLGGATRHHRGEGEPWPDRVELAVAHGALEVPGVGRWPLAEVNAELVDGGPPRTFVVSVPGSSQLLAAAADRATDEVLAALGAGEARDRA